MHFGLYPLLLRFRNSNPVRLVSLGYLSYCLIGWMLLCLPFSMKSPVGALDNLFTAISALSTTGLSTVTVCDRYTFFGQLIILLLVQLGGIGYMTLGSFVVISAKRSLENHQKNIMQTVFSIPKDFRIEKFIVSVVSFTVIIEVIGAAALLPIFIQANSENPVWQAVFHSVSAFCTAGFSLFPTGLESFKDHTAFNFIITALCLIGAMGFIVCVDFWRFVRGKIDKVSLTSRIIWSSTLWILAIGAGLIYVTEPYTGQNPNGNEFLYSLFQAMSALTTVGFNTVPIGALSQSVIVLLSVLMVIGASPSGTGGGLKTTTFSAMLALIRSAWRGDKEVRFWRSIAPDERVKTAVVTFGTYIITLTIGTYLMTVAETKSFLELFFESASALGTVGLSMGITANLSSFGKIILILLMYIGRVGPVTLGMALFVKPELIFDDERSDLAI